jgi:hypothetical protein
MQKVPWLALSALLFSLTQANAQDAFTTFIFLFVDNGIDVSQSVGDRYVKTGVVPQTFTVVDKCVFEGKLQAEIVPGRRFEAAEVRYDFNKAYFDEAKLSEPTIFLGSYYRIPGESGFIYKREHCNGSLCDSSDEKESVSEDFTTVGHADRERLVKAMKYFVQNFCPGKKRK